MSTSAEAYQLARRIHGDAWTGFTAAQRVAAVQAAANFSKPVDSVVVRLVGAAYHVSDSYGSARFPVRNQERVPSTYTLENAAADYLGLPVEEFRASYAPNHDSSRPGVVTYGPR